ncbi:MAG: cysteine synthase family protein [Bacteroidales bacterium]|nr:cysteine synthase family protein [Bacteroidales bacterium]
MISNTISDPRLASKFRELWRIVGNSPLLVISFRYKGEPRLLYAKMEQFNITGSIKDRMALYVLQRAYETNQIKPGDTIVEATSGNTGIAFSAIGKALGHQVQIAMPDWMSKERVDIIRSLGATIIPISKEQGGFLGSIRKTEEIAQTQPNIFLPRQFSNQANADAHHDTTGPELYWQMSAHDLKPDAFVAGVGTGGTVMGVGHFLKEMNPLIKVHPLEPAESPTLTTGCKIGNHRIQGISDEFIPDLVKLNKLDQIITSHDGDAILMAQQLASKLGLAVGISSGANFIGALKVQNQMGSQAAVVTVFSDSNKKYLSTDLMKNEPVKEGYLTPDVELLDYSVFKRVCKTCCDVVNCNIKSIKTECNSCG